jgi:hypothetical protein
MSSLKLKFDSTTNRYSPTTGTRLSQLIKLTATEGIYKITWISKTPTSTSVSIETNISLDGGSTWLGWKVAENNSPIPDIDNTTDLTNAFIQIKQTLQTGNSLITPELFNLHIYIDTSEEINVKETWDSDTRILARFMNSLEAGNVNNDGVKITKFYVKRRNVNSLDDDIYVGEVEYDGINNELEFIDSTQPNTSLIYTIVPIGENYLEGNPKEVEIKSDFTGVWMVDKETGEVLAFDKALGSVGNFDTTFTEDRILIETFSKYSQVYRVGNSTSYESFTLSTVLIPENGKRSGELYQEILQKFIYNHNPKIVKTDNGRIFVCDISNPRPSAPMNTWSGYDFVQLTLDAVEVQDYKEFMEEGLS